jgi:hypothetical protein
MRSVPSTAACDYISGNLDYGSERRLSRLSGDRDEYADGHA